jgi:hypothetical protein
MKKMTLCLLGSFLFALPVQAQLQRTYQYGVIPTENVTSLEIQPVLNVLDNSAHTSSTQTTFKAYHTLSDAWNFGAEIPLVRYESPLRSVAGLGDVMLALAYMHPESLSGGFGWGARMEVFTPTATDEHLGSEKLQLSPSAFVLWAFSPNVFTAVGYKHYWGEWGANDRNDINTGRVRFNMAYLSDSKWWVLTNLYYYLDYKNDNREEFLPEFEIGTLINDGTSIYANYNFHGGGNWQSKDWSASVGFRILYL